MKYIVMQRMIAPWFAKCRFYFLMNWCTSTWRLHY